MATHIDYQPRLAGQPVDPEVTGGAVLTLLLYTNPARTGEPAHQAGPAARVEPYVYRFTLDPDPQPSRYWLTVTWRQHGASETLTDSTGRVDLPVNEYLVVSPEAVAADAGLPLPLPAADREVVEEAIRDAQTDVEGYLRQSVVPVQRVDTGRLPLPMGWVLSASEPVSQVLSAVPETDPVTGALTGTYTVTYLTGLDARTDPTLAPIRRYVIAHATLSPQFLRLYRAALGPRTMKQTSIEGQSVTYEDRRPVEGEPAEAGSGLPGALPSLETLQRWRLTNVFQRRG